MSGAFREDLFYRLNVFPIALPPLRDRIADIPLLLEYFVGRFAKKGGKKINQINQHTLAMCKAYDWPGNIRELQNVVERGVILSEGDTFSVDENWFKRRPKESLTGLDGLPALAKREVEMIKAALAECDGRIGGRSGAAAKLKVPRQTLESKIRRFGIDNYLQNIRLAK
jgi:formate hydrogenlyase transcriptional activator